MTHNQIAFHSMMESKRANLAKEQENERSNRAREAETERSNVANQLLELMSHEEKKRHNKQTEWTDRQKANAESRRVGDAIGYYIGNTGFGVEPAIKRVLQDTPEKNLNKLLNLGG